MLAARVFAFGRRLGLGFLIFVQLPGNIPAVWAQTTTATNPAPIIVSNADEVSVDLVVRDKKNRLVTDLKPSDIVVTDSGVPVPISNLRLVAGDSERSHLVTLVFDRLDSSAAKNAREIAVKILKMAPVPGISFAVLKVRGRLNLLQTFTTDRNALSKAIGLATSGEKSEAQSSSAVPEKALIAAATASGLSGASVSANERTLSRMILASLEDSQRIVQDQHASPPLAGLLALSRTQRQLTGRKIVVYFAQGMELDSNSMDMIHSIIGAANQSGVSIYTVDANALDREAGQGLMAAVAIGNVKSNNAINPAPTGINAPHGAYGPGMVSQISDQLSRLENEGPGAAKDPLAALAISTGGGCMGAADSLKKPLGMLIEDMTNYYEASCVPIITNFDGQFRAGVVKPVRKDLRIRSTAGYFALPPGAGAGIRPFEAPLLKILTEPQLPVELRFASKIFQMGDLPDGNANTVAVEVPLSELEIKKDSSTHLFSAHLAIVAQIKNKAGETVEHFSEDIPRHGTFDAIDEVRSEVITLQRHFSAVPGEYLLEAVVLDRNSGKAGAQRTNFEISKEVDGPSLSDVAIVRRTEPFKTEMDPLEPLRYESGKIVPDLTADITSKAGSISLFFIIHFGEQTAGPAELAMEVLRNGDEIASMPLPLRKSTGHGAVPYMASIKAASLPAGRYEVTARLTQDGKTAASSASFVVGGAELASATVPSRGPATGSTGDIENPAELKPQELGIESRRSGRLTITSVANPASAPSEDQLQAIVAAARSHALSYSLSLPNFTCVEITDRSVDPAGNGHWRHKDKFAELLRYVDNNESRTMLKVNGESSSMQRSELNGPISQGEFGGVLNAVFRLSSKADFQYRENATLGSGTVLVLSYRVARENSNFGLSDSNQQISVGFHGLVYIDSLTSSVRRITVEADSVPGNFSLRSTSITVEYDYIAIGTHDYLVPIRAEVSLTQGKRKGILNEIEFRNYKRYASQAKIIYGNQSMR